MVAIKDKEVTQADIDRVDRDREGGATSRPTSRSCTSSTQEFIIDGQEDVREPLGMSGVRLEVKVHIVTGAVSAAQNIIKCVRRCGLEVNDLILQPLASAIAVLSDDEKDLGVCLVDIGGGTTDIAVFTDGAIRHTAVIPIAGDQITNDIAMALRTPTKDAEEIKMRHGCALRQLADPNEMIEVPGVGDRAPRAAVAPDAGRSDRAARRGALFAGAGRSCAQSGFEELLSSGIVLTGGSRADAGHGRAGRGDLPHAGAHGRAALRAAASPTWCAARATRRRWACCWRGCDQHQRDSRSRACRAAGFKQVLGTDEGMVQGKFLGVSDRQSGVQTRFMQSDKGGRTCLKSSTRNRRKR